MIADIASGHTAGADIAFLVAVILAVLAAVLAALLPRTPTGWATTTSSVLGWAAVAAIALGFLIL